MPRHRLLVEPRERDFFGVAAYSPVRGSRVHSLAGRSTRPTFFCSTPWRRKGADCTATPMTTRRSWWTCRQPSLRRRHRLVVERVVLGEAVVLQLVPVGSEGRGAAPVGSADRTAFCLRGFGAAAPPRGAAAPRSPPSYGSTAGGASPCSTMTRCGASPPAPPSAQP